MSEMCFLYVSQKLLSECPFLKDQANKRNLKLCHSYIFKVAET